MILFTTPGPTLPYWERISDGFLPTGVRVSVTQEGQIVVKHGHVIKTVTSRASDAKQREALLMITDSLRELGFRTRSYWNGKYYFFIGKYEIRNVEGIGETWVAEQEVGACAESEVLALAECVAKCGEKEWQF